MSFARLIQSLLAITCVCCPMSCNRNVRNDRNEVLLEANEEITASYNKSYMFFAEQQERHVQIEVSADEELKVEVATGADGDKKGETLAKAEKSKSIKLDATIPPGRMAFIFIKPDKTCKVKTTVRKRHP